MVEPSSVRVSFPGRGAFSRDLEAAANTYLAGKSRRDAPRMYLKAAVMLTWFVASWVVLVFVASGWLQGFLAATSLGLSIAGIGMSVQHDANHAAFSRHDWVNRVFGAGLDIMGVSSHFWRRKHNAFHHTYTNVQGVDYDLDFGPLARLSPEQEHRWYHRFQHLYLWCFYGFLLPKWVFFDDWMILRTRFIGKHAVGKLTRGQVFEFLAWKLFFFGWAIVIPALFHPLWQVAIFHLVAAFALGGTLGTVFQLAHCTNEVEFPAPDANGLMKEEWTLHQLQTCVDFAPKNPLITWFVGGLNFQVEHHLFPKVCHLHYPALAQVVAAVAKKHGVKHRSQATFFAALGSHFGHLRALGRPLKVVAPELALEPTPIV